MMEAGLEICRVSRQDGTEEEEVFGKGDRKSDKEGGGDILLEEVDGRSVGSGGPTLLAGDASSLVSVDGQTEVCAANDENELALMLI